ASLDLGAPGEKLAGDFRVPADEDFVGREHGSHRRGGFDPHLARLAGDSCELSVTGAEHRSGTEDNALLGGDREVFPVDARREVDGDFARLSTDARASDGL